MAEHITSVVDRKIAVSQEDVLFAAQASPLKQETVFRTASLEHYVNAPIPDRVTHLWRYSDPTLFFPEAAPRRSTQNEGALTVIASQEALDAAGVHPVPLHLSKEGLALLGKAVPSSHGLFEALNGALFTESIFIRVPRGVVLDTPIQIVHRADRTGAVDRVVVTLESGASADVVEIFEDGSENARAVSVSELFVGENASLRHAIVQQWEPKTRGFVTVRAAVERDGLFRETSLALGGTTYKCDLGADLRGVGAQSEIIGVSFADKKQHMDFHTVQQHSAERTHSQIRFKTALGGKADSAYTGLIRIAEEAALSEAFQDSRSLMLSDKAHSHAIPELEILTNDVQCSHAAAASPIDDNELFYLMSRGIAAVEARRILVRGFFNDALSKIPMPLREQAAAALEERLKRTFKEEETK